MKTKEDRESLSYADFSEISKDIIKYHGVFYKFWDLIRPSYTNSKNVPTACVVFNKENQCVDFLINKKFWDKLSQEKKNFIVCHECLHVILEHGKRACSISVKLNPEITNACLDIPINEMLVKYFGFNKKDIDPKGKFCWANTVFPKEKVPNDKGYEFYFNKMKNDSECAKVSICGMGSGESSDCDLETNSHESLDSFNDESAQKSIQDLADSLSEEETASLKDICDRIARNEENNQDSKITSRGNTAGGMVKLLGKVKPKRKRKWETVIKKWSLKFSRTDREENHWLVKARRNSLINTEFFIPSDIECEIKKTKDEKVDVWMMLDTSGSCADLAPRFWRAANSLPKEKFNVHYYCFDTQVYKLKDSDVNAGKLYGFGGTCFISIENFIQKSIKKEGKKYPAAVFVLTDGAGTNVKPQDPKKWYWFLSEDNKYCIPKDSHIFSLKDFE
jgi:predicted metal-dependent peptidase